MNKKILVTGSSGFIGTYLSNKLLKCGFQVIGIDIISSNNIINDNYTFYQVDITNIKELDLIKSHNDIYCVCHLAAKIRVDESMILPDIYYLNNVNGTINVLNWCNKNNIKNFIFASTAAVYGNMPIDQRGYKENEASNPASIYGKTKLICEQIINDYSNKLGFSSYIFRFFNVCGGSELNHGTPIHLLPLVINNIINNKDIFIFGTDYNTKDGTCIRDYIHLEDISDAFILAINNKLDKNMVKTYNLGSSNGYTVKEIIDKIMELYPNKVNINVLEKGRRMGDFDVLIANSELIEQELGWKPKCNLNKMIIDTIKSLTI